MKRIIPCILVLLGTAFPFPLGAEELELINRPVNTSGLTGLIQTTIPFILPQRTLEFGLVNVLESSFVPKYASSVISATVSYGLSPNTEFGIVVPYRYVDTDPGVSARGMGDVEASFKWNLVRQPEYSFRPAVSIFGNGIMPTGDRENGLNSVVHWGCRLGLSVGSELAWDDIVIGIYADAQGAAQDASDQVLRDSYALFNAGVLVPISKYRNLQAMVEYNRRSGKDVVTVDGTDYNAVTYGLRLVSERLNLTFGAQMLHRKEPGYDNSSKTVALISYKY